MTVEHVVLDVGRVLVDWDPEIPYRRLVPDDAERAWFLATVCSPAWNAEQDRGRSWADGEAVLVAEFPDQEERIRAFRRGWAEMVPGTIDGSVALLRSLVGAGVDVTLLTNFAADTFVECRAMYPVLDEVRGVTVSGEVGLVKPDPAVFRHHAATFGLDPARTLFVDDSPANVEGARSVGWRAVVFTDPSSLAVDLRAHGLSV